MPVAPASSPYSGAGTSHSSLDISWAALTSSSDTGGALDILEYEVLWDQGNSTSAIFLSNTLALSRTLSSGVVAGTTYVFKYRARNIIGWGDYSPELSVLAASSPDPPAEPPSTTAHGLVVNIDWSAPVANGSPI